MRERLLTIVLHRLALVLTVLLIGGVLGGLTALATGPFGRPDDQRAGDSALADDVESAVADTTGAPGDAAAGFATLSVGRISDGRTTFAGIGGDPVPAPETPYEAGSITKTFTGMLLADAVERGELKLDDPVSTYLPELADTPAGQSTLRQLATHTSGLPSIPPMGLATTMRAVTGGDPYAGWDTERVLAATRMAPVSGRGEYAYSTLGVSLLGHAEARAAGATDWQELARRRILRPLGMDHTTFGTGVPARPHRANGWPVQPWTGDGFAPAGSETRTTAGDLMRFAQAILDGTAPGMTALAPTTDIGDGERIGLVWMTTDVAGHQVSWHNGITGGSRAMLAIDRTEHRAVVVLGNSTRGTESLGFRLLVPDGPAPSVAPPVSGLVVGVITLGLVAALIVAAVRERSRVQVAGAALGAGFGLVLALAYGPWGWLPGWLFGVLAGVAVGAAGLAVRRGAGLPTLPPRRAALAVINTLVGGGMLVLAIIAV